MELNEIFELWIKVCEQAFKTGRNTLSISLNGYDHTIQTLFWDTKSKVKKAMESVDTEFLVLPLLEDGLNKIAELYLVRIVDVISGVTSQEINELIYLQKALAECDVKKQWELFSDQLRCDIESVGLNAATNISDITGIADILLDAFTFLTQNRNRIYRIASGKDSGEKATFISAIPQFSTAAEFMEVFRRTGIPCCVMFAAITPTMGQTEDRLYEWKNGHPEERTRNFMKHDNLTREQFQASPDLYAASFVIGIKRGENVWMISNNSDGIVRNQNFIEYGKRKSYLPYQLLFANSPKPDLSCMALAVPKMAWNIQSAVDQEQSLWIPALLWSIRKKFFTGPLPEEEEHFFLEGASVTLKGLSAPMEKADNLPTVRAIRNLAVDVFEVPDTFQTFPIAQRIIDVLDLTAEDIQDAPLFQKGLTTRTAFQRTAFLESRQALCSAVYKKITLLYLSNIFEVYRFCVQHYVINKDFILEQLSHPGSRVNQLSHFIIDGQNGEKTSKDDGRIRHWNSGYFKQHTSDTVEECKFFIPNTLVGKRPPVKIIIMPETTADISLLTGVGYDDLPKLLQLFEVTLCQTRFLSELMKDVPSDKQIDPLCCLSINAPAQYLCNITILMSKTEYKKMNESGEDDD